MFWIENVQAGTNGQCDIRYDYSDDKKKPYPWAATIVLWGKRIPPHPAMTRYLIAHEYGHAVAQAVVRSQGKSDADLGKFYTEYRALRKNVPVAPKYYGGGSWHESTQEIFANDFRILVAKSEVEFWPHPTTERPEKAKAIRDFWKNVKV